MTFVLLATLAPAAPVSKPAAPAPVSPLAPGSASASLPPEVRLRKLHLVRPDLIPYPIAYEVVC